MPLIFGDGLNALGDKVSHVYKYRGTYNVVLNGISGTDHSVSRTKVTVLEPDVSISEMPEGVINIANNGNTEINLGGWKIMEGWDSFSISSDTIVDAGKNISISIEDTKLPISSDPIRIDDPSGNEVAAASSISGQTVASEESTVQETYGTSTDKTNGIVSDNNESLSYEQSPATGTSQSESHADNQVYSEPAAVISATSDVPTKSLFEKIISFPIDAVKSIARLFYSF